MTRLVLILIVLTVTAIVSILTDHGLIASLVSLLIISGLTYEKRNETT